MDFFLTWQFLVIQFKMEAIRSKMICCVMPDANGASQQPIHRTQNEKKILLWWIAANLQLLMYCIFASRKPNWRRSFFLPTCNCWKIDEERRWRIIDAIFHTSLWMIGSTFSLHLSSEFEYLIAITHFDAFLWWFLTLLTHFWRLLFG